MPSITNVHGAREPIKTSPRNPYEEGLLNIAFLIKNAAQESVESLASKFVRPRLLEVHTSYLTEPAPFPCADVRFIQEDEPENVMLGSNPSEIWPMVFSVRVFQGNVEPKLKSIELTRNLYAVRDVLKHNADLNGLCSGKRSRIIAVRQDETILGEGRNARIVAGGAIVLRAFFDVSDYQYYDGVHARRVVFSTGARH